MGRDGGRRMIKSIWYEFDNWSDSLDVEDSNSDVIFELEDGCKWVASFFTYKNIETLRKKNQSTGECLCGKFYCSSDMILILTMSKELIQQVIQQMVMEGTVELYCSRV